MDTRRFRNLGRLLEGIIFECPTQDAVERLLAARVCRAPKEQMEYLKFLKVDRPAFVFDREKRLLHGVLKVESPAELICQPHSSQPVVEIKISLAVRYAPLRECVFSPKIQLCYFCALEFHFELDMEETLEIMELFHQSVGREVPIKGRCGLINGNASAAADQTNSTIHRQWERRKEMALANLASSSAVAAEPPGGGEPSTPKTPRNMGEINDKSGGKRGGGPARSSSAGKDREKARESSRTPVNDSERNRWVASLQNGCKTSDGGGGGGGITMPPSPPPNTGTSDDSMRCSQIGTCGAEPSDCESISNVSGDIVPHRMFNNIVGRRRSSSSQQNAGFGVGSLPVSFGRQSQSTRCDGDMAGTVVTQQMAVCMGGQGGGVSEGNQVGANVQVVIQTRAEVSSQTSNGGVVITDVGGGQSHGQQDDDAVNLEIHRLASQIDFLKREVGTLDREKESARKRSEDNMVLLRTQAELLRRMQSDADTCRRNMEDIEISRRREQEAHAAHNQTMQDEKRRLLNEIDRMSGLVETLTSTRSNEVAQLQKENAQLNSTLQMLRSEMDLMWTKNDALRKENQKFVDVVDDRAKLAMANEELVLQNDSLRQQLAEAQLAVKASYSFHLGNASSNAPLIPEVKTPHLPFHAPQGPGSHGAAMPSHHLSSKREHGKELPAHTLERIPVEDEAARFLPGVGLNNEPCKRGQATENSVSDLPLSHYRPPHLSERPMDLMNLDSLHLAPRSQLAISPPSLPSNIQENQPDFGGAEAPGLPVPMVDEAGKGGGCTVPYRVEEGASSGQHDCVAQVSEPVSRVHHIRSKLAPGAEQVGYADASTRHPPTNEAQGYAARSRPESTEQYLIERARTKEQSKISHQTPCGKESGDMRLGGQVLSAPNVKKRAPSDQTSPNKSERWSGGSRGRAPVEDVENRSEKHLYPPGIRRVVEEPPPPQAGSTMVLHEVNHVRSKPTSSSMQVGYDAGQPPAVVGLSPSYGARADGRLDDVSTLRSEAVCAAPGSTSNSEERSTVASSGFGNSGPKSQLYILGGTNEEEMELKTSEIYDFQKGSWRVAPDCCLPSEAGPSSLATVSVGSRMYVMGGMSEEWEGRGFFYFFHPDSGRWERLADLPTPRSAVGLVECDGKIVAVGGRTEESSLMVVEIYDPELNRWFEGPCLKHRRAFHSTVVCDGSIFAVGGMRDQQGLMKSAEHLDLRRGKWESVGRMSRRRTALGCASNQQYIMAAGGVSCDDHGGGYCVLNTTEIFDPRVSMWFNGESMLDSRAWFSLTYFNGAMYAVGGRKAIEGEANTGMERFELGKDGRWCAMESPTRRAFHSCCVVEGL
ncbi:hypothetical protein BSKO_06601 [Bryopsis sp. KO-2023]|nr:hypothetical protein BSKO_06601 [Bryopsis sp. KO-2023]